MFNITPFVKTGFVRDLARDDAADLTFFPEICQSSPVDVQPSPCHRIEPGLIAKATAKQHHEERQKIHKNDNSCQEIIEITSPK